MKTLHTFALAAAAVLAITACKREAPEAPAAPATTASEVPAQMPANVDATAVVDNTAASADAPVLDSKALAGKFGDGESVLELRADGSYQQTLQAGGSAITADGSWSAQGAQALLLDPNSKSAEDARFEVVSNDELRSSDGKHTFRRIAAP